jgi:hypothetical protein
MILFQNLLQTVAQQLDAVAQRTIYETQPTVPRESSMLSPLGSGRRTADASCGCLDLFDHEEATISLVLSHERATEEHLSRKGPFVKQADPGDSDVAIWSG